MDQNFDSELQVYRNLIKFLAFRRLRLIGEPLRPAGGMAAGGFTEPSAFVSSVSRFSRWRVDAEGPAGPVTVFIITEPSNKTLREQVRGLAGEVVFILKKTKDCKKVKAPDSAAYVRLCTYDAFVTDVPASPLVPVHSFADPAEFALTGLPKEQLPKILASDPPVVWLGGRRGDVLKIVRPSETAGLAVVYRLVL